MSMKTLSARLQYDGGNASNDRIKKNKLRSFKKALENDYNSRTIKTLNKESWKALVNIDKLTADYDRKIVSIEYEAGLEPGDTFEIMDDGTHWMIYLPILTETAYLRSDIIRCRYTIEIKGIEYWIYVQGPVETDTRWFIKKNINILEQNLSARVLIKLNPDTEEVFSRLNRVEIANRIWEVQATDKISTEGILEAVLKETFDRPHDKIPAIKDMCPIFQILGPGEVNHDMVYGYEIRGDYMMENGKWWVEGNPRVEIEEIIDNGRYCRVRVHDGAVGTFRIYYGVKASSYYRDVLIKACEPPLLGELTVYPYDIVEYTSTIGQGKFFLQTKSAKIISQDGVSCRIEIVSTRKSEFTLYFESEDGVKEHIDIQILSL